jgi:pimeloyl-ACP methyl ester carboxylesterase
MAKPLYQVQGSGPPFVYVPGLEGTGKLFYKQAEDLARDHTVITFPLRPDGHYTMSQLVKDLVWIIRDAGFARATVLGESFGGLLVLATALAHPAIFERMILVSTFACFANRAKINFGVLLYSLLPYALIKAYRSKRARHELYSADIAEIDRITHHELTRVIPFEGYMSRLRIIRETDLRARLSEIKVPALIVAGTEDRLLDAVGAARELTQKLPRARLKLLEGTGHMVLLSNRVRVRDWLVEFEQF